MFGMISSFNSTGTTVQNYEVKKYWLIYLPLRSIWSAIFIAVSSLPLIHWGWSCWLTDTGQSIANVVPEWVWASIQVREWGLGWVWVSLEVPWSILVTVELLWCNEFSNTLTVETNSSWVSGSLKKTNSLEMNTHLTNQLTELEECHILIPNNTQDSPTLHMYTTNT